VATGLMEIDASADVDDSIQNQNNVRQEIGVPGGKRSHPLPSVRNPFINRARHVV